MDTYAVYIVACVTAAATVGGSLGWLVGHVLVQWIDRCHQRADMRSWRMQRDGYLASRGYPRLAYESDDSYESRVRFIREQENTYE